MRLTAILKPEYLLRPRQLLRRLYWSIFQPRTPRLVTTLPWGWPIEVDPNEVHGKPLLHLGVYDLAVSETLWRLCDAGETALDLGANIGYMTALLARRVGRAGRVLSFEAHPAVAAELQANVSRWQTLIGDAVIQVRAVALSDSEGTVRLELPPDFFTGNRGLGRVIADDANGAPVSNSSVVSVPSTTLDACLTGISQVGVAKMDVEGHEEAVLRGAEQALRDRRIRDWVFEHHPVYPSAVTDVFERHGYQVFQIQKQFFKPALIVAATPIKRSFWNAQSFLATLDAERALQRLQSPGWQSL